jgi:ATP-binding cassette subfamily F protein uup
MDRMVDHLFAFEGDGIIRDYPGNYTQYRDAQSKGLLENNTQQLMKEHSEVKEVIEKKEAAAATTTSNQPVKKLSFKEKFELESLEKDMPALQKEKEGLEIKMSTNLSYDELQKAAERISEIIASLDAMEMRWLELSEKNG